MVLIAITVENGKEFTFIMKTQAHLYPWWREEMRLHWYFHSWTGYALW